MAKAKGTSKSIARTSGKLAAPTVPVSSTRGRSLPVTRFAHPFYTEAPAITRLAYAGARRMTDVVKANLEPIPPVQGDSVMTLADVIGAQGAAAIEAEGQMIFHTFGDTGHEDGRAQQLVADAATREYNIDQPSKSPAFLFMLGDVIYYDNTDRGYHAQFYVPYKTYPGKIIAIPGNHDGELFKWDGKPTGQKKSLDAFVKNFCQKGNAANITSGTILRHMVNQPGVYWRLITPFADIVGLYSNMAENPGYLQGSKAGTAQKKWLNKTLATIKAERAAGKRKALIIAVHHPPISNGSHGSSTDMLADIDDSCKGIKPDMLLAAHSHDYQRYTRFVPANGKTLETPYLVVGTGGRGLSTKLGAATGQVKGDHRYDKSCLGYGLLTVTVSATKITGVFNRVDEHNGNSSVFDQFSVDLTTNKLT